MIYCRIVLFVFLFSVCNASDAQGDNWDFTYAIKSEFGFNGKSKSIFNLSISAGIKRYILQDNIETDGEDANHFFNQLGRHVYFAYQPAINIYGSGLGVSIIDGLKKTQIDFVNSLFITAGQPNHGLVTDYQYISPFNSFTARAIKDHYSSSLALGTNFIVNNHNRNQVTGFVNVNIGRVVRIGYYNDGPPFDILGLADRFDRWWTGGGFIEVSFDQGFSRNRGYIANSLISYHFDRFTGDVQDAYRVSGALGFRYVPDANWEEAYFNNARGKFAWHFHEDNVELSVQWLGYLKGDIQNAIHKALKFPYHLTYAKRYRVFGIQHHFISDIKI